MTIEQRVERIEKALLEFASDQSFFILRQALTKEIETAENNNNQSNIGYYVSDSHCKRAISYMYEHWQDTFDLSQLLDLWAEALNKTMYAYDLSPIGPDPERVKETLDTSDERRQSWSELN